MDHPTTHNEPQVNMGLPLSNGKLAMWLFLASDCLFFLDHSGDQIGKLRIREEGLRDSFADSEETDPDLRFNGRTKSQASPGLLDR